MGSIFGEETIEWEGQDSSEKIYVAVRLRPLSEREISRNDVPDWECINNTTIIFKNSLQERSLLPVAYTFDRVFGYSSQTKQVYEEAAKKIALSVLSGINSTIFAYGQTGSGKTFTMSGITEYAIQDIYDYIEKHCERKFVLKFSAMEIYNEAVKDLLRSDGPVLRLLDDPERGTVVDKLTEVTLRDSDQLRELLAICADQRQIGETSLNELSSRSHQILRLTVESEARHYLGAENSSTLTASVNFVDLAGSERASQTLSAGTRLKEGCHINRSLLTLGTVIRKLSKGRNGHVPYRDSKLTRILQNSLGGNARTAIICTMSPAHSHVEQSRNTLHFASCAKQVSTNAQVNVVMSEKALVKQLQKELARLETELRNLTSLSASGASASVIREKELLIQKMDKEIRELTQQRDTAQSRIEDILRSGGDFQTPKSWVYMHNHEKGSWTDDQYSASEASDIIDPLRFDVASRASHLSERYEGVISNKIEDQFPENNEEQFLSDDTSPRLYIEKYFGSVPSQGWENITQPNNNFEDNCKEVQCIETDSTKRNSISSPPSPQNGGQSPCLPEKDVSNPNAKGDRSKSCEAILIVNDVSNPSAKGDRSKSCEAILIVNDVSNPSAKGDRSKSCEAILIVNDVSNPSAKGDRTKSCEAILTTIMKSQSVKENENTLQIEADNEEKLCDVETLFNSDNLHRENSRHSVRSECLNEDDEQDSTVKQVIEPKAVEHHQYDQDMDEEEKMEGGHDKTTYERQKREIIQLWDVCRTPLVHRTYFLLLFKGDPSDAVYLEVEHRRLSFLNKSMRGVGIDEQLLKQASTQKALNREREMLSRRMLKKFSAKEREGLYQKWGIDIKSKQRRMQLCRRLWTDATNMDHINESAAIVAKLVGFKEQGQEMFGLSFLPKHSNSRSFSWKHTLPSII